jgi:PIN domain nuclease of toxin-antitoxin system
MLLDTHVLIWYLTGDPQLPVKLKERITAEPLVYVSAAVIWEIAIKGSMGKLELGGKPMNSAEAVSQILRECSEQQFLMLDISSAHAAAAPFLKGAHKDPFDRILAAQAVQEAVPLMSADSVFDDMGVQRLWNGTARRRTTRS